jgi:hypothetical protein
MYKWLFWARKPLEHNLLAALLAASERRERRNDRY